MSRSGENEKGGSLNSENTIDRPVNFLSSSFRIEVVLEDVRFGPKVQRNTQCHQQKKQDNAIWKNSRVPFVI